MIFRYSSKEIKRKLSQLENRADYINLNPDSFQQVFDRVTNASAVTNDKEVLKKAAMLADMVERSHSKKGIKEKELNNFMMSMKKKDSKPKGCKKLI